MLQPFFEPWKNRRSEHCLSVTAGKIFSSELKQPDLLHGQGDRGGVLHGAGARVNGVVIRARLGATATTTTSTAGGPAAAASNQQQQKRDHQQTSQADAQPATPAAQTKSCQGHSRQGQPRGVERQPTVFAWSTQQCGWRGGGYRQLSARGTAAAYRY